MLTGIIDYGAGNLQSVANAVRSLGNEVKYLHAGDDFDSVSHIILPGVGAFGDCMQKLRQQQLVEPLRVWMQADKPLLGICVGYQVLFAGSQESPGVEGLGILEGEVRRFDSRAGFKIPHMGWNECRPCGSDPRLWQGCEAQPYMYFVHSYYPQGVDEVLVSSRCDYIDDFASSISRGRLHATQFHPEKSQSAGLRLIANFLALDPA